MPPRKLVVHQAVELGATGLSITFYHPRSKRLMVNTPLLETAEKITLVLKRLGYAVEVTVSEAKDATA